MSIKPTVLVTGGNGFLGRRIVARLAGDGYRVRAMVRQGSPASGLDLPGVDVVRGDVTIPDSMRECFDGTGVVVHAAADTSGTREGAETVTVGGTRNVLALCREYQVSKLVYISSCSVYSTADCGRGEVVDEDSKIDPKPECRGAYTWGKQKAERLVLDAIADKKIKATCLRPGLIYGDGGENFNPMIGFAFGKLLIIIDSKNYVLPLVYVENMVDAILSIIPRDDCLGRVYNVVDNYRVDKRQYVETLVRKLFPGRIVVYVPYRILAFLVEQQENLFKLLNIKPLMTSYRFESSQRAVLFDSSRVSKESGWASRTMYDEAVQAIAGTGGDSNE